MTSIGVPDLLTNARVAGAIADVKRDFTRVGEELASGLHANIVKASGGDPSRLYSIERDLQLNAARGQSVDLAQGRASVAQKALGQVQARVEDLGARLAGFATLGDLRAADKFASQARGDFAAVVTALNSRSGGRSLFAGAATDAPALAAAEDILADIQARVGGATDADSLIAAVDDYFSDPAGFATSGYLGSAEDAPAAGASEGERLQVSTRADDDALKTAMSALALAVMASENPASLSDSARIDVMRDAAERGLTAGAEVVSLRSNLGAVEERLEEIGLTIEAERSFLERARASIRARDPFETAAEFTALETQMQTTFAVTARLTSLRLTDFLR